MFILLSLRLDYCRVIQLRVGYISSVGIKYNIILIRSTNRLLGTHNAECELGSGTITQVRYKCSAQIRALTERKDTPTHRGTTCVPPHMRCHKCSLCGFVRAGFSLARSLDSSPAREALTCSGNVPHVYFARRPSECSITMNNQQRRKARRILWENKRQQSELWEGTGKKLGNLMDLYHGFKKGN